MKRFVWAALPLFVIVWLTACGKTQSDSMVIGRSEFSQETNQVLQIIDDEIAFFDYSVDDSVKSLSIDIWQWQNGSWNNLGQIIGDIGDSRQIAIKLDENSYEIFQITKDGHTKSSYPNTADFSKSGMKSDYRLSNTATIEINKEIPLWVRLGTDKNFMEADSSIEFRNADCNAGLAVTITFLDKEVP